MNVVETGAVMDIIKATYPAWKAMPQTVAIWAQCFADDSAEVVLTAVKTFIATDEQGFAPSPGQIRAIIKHIAPESDELTEGELVAIIMKAISNGIYGAYTEFEALPPIAQEIVGDPDQLTRWAMLTDGLNTVVESHIRKTYRAAVERAKYRKAAAAIGSANVSQLVSGAFKQIGGK